MKIQRYLISSVFCAILFLGAVWLIPSVSGAEEAKTNKTLDNLQAAYNGESNANGKYLAYALKADEEGYHKVARLFRATASAEEVHLKNHANVIKGMGGTPEAHIKLPEIKSTAGEPRGCPKRGDLRTNDHVSRISGSGGKGEKLGEPFRPSPMLRKRKQNMPHSTRKPYRIWITGKRRMSIFMYVRNAATP